MAEALGGSDYIALAANIVAAYVSHNSVPSAEIPNLISQIYMALKRVSDGQGVSTAEAGQAGRADQAVGDRRVYRLSRRRIEVQIAQAASAHAL